MRPAYPGAPPAAFRNAETMVTPAAGMQAPAYGHQHQGAPPHPVASPGSTASLGVGMDQTALAPQVTDPGLVATAREDTNLTQVERASNTHGKLLGDFRLDRKIGQGGMGEVYLATQVSLDRKVAVKLLPASLANSENFIERFEREAKSAASLVHANVIQVYAFGVVDESPYFAMEFVDGEDLSDRLKRSGILPLSEILDMMIGVSSALAAAADKGIVHRDIKPSNVMLDKSGGVKVMDFGLAKAASTAGSNLTQSGLIMGTPNYMSPEQARGDTVDHRSDLYSLGIMFFQLLTGKLPFTADTPASLIFKHVYEEPPTPRSRNPDVPAFLESIVLKLIKKDPNDRYRDAHGLLTDLKSFRSDPAQAGTAVFESSRDVRSEAGRRERFQEHPTSVVDAGEARPGTTPGTTVRVRSALFPKLVIGLFALVFIASGVGYWGHEAGHWRLPYLPKAGEVVDAPKPFVPPVKPKKDVIFVLNRVLPAGVTARWNGLDPKRFIILVAGTPMTVREGDYLIHFERKGYKVLELPIEVYDGGTNVKGTESSLADIGLSFLPSDELAKGLEEGEDFIVKGDFAAAVVALESAAALDPEYRAKEHAPQVKVLLAKARQSLAGKLKNEENWATLIAKARKDEAEKRWREAAKGFGMIPKVAPQYATAQEVLKAIGERLTANQKLLGDAKRWLSEGKVEDAADGLRKLAESDPHHAESIAARDAAVAALALIKSSRTGASAGDEAWESADYGKAKAAYAPAAASLGDYLKTYGTADQDGKSEHERLLGRLKKLEQLIPWAKQLDAALEKKDYQQALSSARKVLSLHDGNMKAQRSAGGSDLALKRAEIGRTLKALDRALVAGSLEKVVAFLAPKAQGFRKYRNELAEFYGVGRFIRSEHKLVSILPAGEQVIVKLSWRFELRFPEVGRSVKGRRTKTVTYQALGSGAERRWSITKIAP